MSVNARLILATMATILGSTTVVPSAMAVCPEVSSYAVCDPEDNEVCYVSSGVWTCDLIVDGDYEGAVAYLIYDPSDQICTGPGDYCAFGWNAAGNEFCCEADPGIWTGASLWGSSYGDYLYLQYDDDTYGEFDLSGYVGPPATFDGRIYGNAEIDYIYGSRYDDSPYYKDILAGGGDGDFVHGEEGNDALYGGDGGDYIWGGPGDDWIYGESGEDTIFGGAGSDHIDGGGFGDSISGGSESDTIVGGNGDDIVCGDGGDDNLGGSDANDDIWGGDGTDVGNGGPGTDECGLETPTGCESTIYTDPGCPVE